MVSEVLRPRIPIDTVRLGVEDRFHVLEEPPADPPILVQVGVHRRIKEPLVTLRAFEEIAGRTPHELHFVGGWNPLLEPLQARADGNQAIAARVKFYWPGEEAIPGIYNRASLVVHPCPEEGFGFVPLEALACGAHVLARAPAVREILGPFGCYFDDEGSLASRILECLAEGPRGTRSERVNHATGFTFRRMAEETLAAYEAAAS